MAEVDGNGPTIEIGIDMDRVKNDADKMQTTLVGSIEAIDARVNAMQKNFSTAMNEISSLPDQMAKGMADVLRGRDDAKRQQIDWRRDEDQDRRRVVDFERKRMDQWKIAIDQSKQIVAGFRNMAIAASAVVTAGMGIREMLNFTNDLARMDLAIKTFGMNSEQFFRFRNLMREGGIKDGEIFAIEDTMANAFRTAREKGGTGLLNENQKIALGYFSRYSQNIDPMTARNADSSRMNFAQWQKEIMLAMGKFYNDKSINLSKEMRAEIIAAFTGNNLSAQYLAGLTPAEIERQDKNAKREAESLQKNIENNKKVQELKTALETNVVDLLAKMSPEITSILDCINKFAQNPENVKLLAQGLRDLGNVIFQLLGKALNVMGFLGIKTPESLKKLVGGNFNENPSIEMSKERRHKIEKALNAKIEEPLDNYLPWNKKSLVITDKDGSVIKINSADESIESLKERLKAKTQERMRLNNWEKIPKKKGTSTGLGGWLFPSAHAKEIHYNPLANSWHNQTQSKAYNGKDIQSKQKYLESLEQKYGLPKGVLDAQWLQESSRGRNMLSGKGAKGDFGFMDATAREYGVNVKDFYSSAQGAAKYMHALVKKYHGDINKARAAYNWGMGNVDRISRQYGNDWLSHTPDETHNYVTNTARNALLYQRRMGALNAQRPTLQQMQAQTKVQKVLNSRTATSGDSHYNVSIHVNNGDPQQIAQAFDKKINEIKRRNQNHVGFMNADHLNGWSGIS